MKKKVKGPKISLKDKFILSPIEKHILYKKFPYKLVIHLFLVMLTTIQATNVVDSDYTSHAREQFRVFKYVFLGSTNEENTEYFFSLPDYQNHLQTLLSNFESLDTQLYQNFFSNFTNFTMSVYYTRQFSNNYTFENSTFPIDIYSGMIGPIDPNNATSVKTQAFISAITLAQIQVENIVTLLYLPDGSTNCMAWNITLSYNFETYSNIEAAISANNQYCTMMTNLEQTPLYQGFERASFGINLMVLLASLVSLILSIRHIYAVATIYMTTRHFYKQMQQNQGQEDFKRQSQTLLENTGATEMNLKDFLEKDIPWEDLPLKHKLKFFNFWFIFGIIGNFFQIIGALSIIITFQQDVGQDILSIDNIFVGFGCMFAWFQLMYYLKFDRGIILMTSTLEKSLTENLVFFGLIIPVFVGFTILGQAFFWAYSKFSNTGTTMTSLFSLSCGDIVYETFTDTQNESVFKQLYLILYLLAFYTSAQNIFVAIVMEGYDRCTLRKEIDNDDPFPVLDNLIGQIKGQGKQPEQLSPSFYHEIPSGMLPLEQEEDPTQTCINRLNSLKENVLAISFLIVRQCFKQMKWVEFFEKERKFHLVKYYQIVSFKDHDDERYLQQVYKEELTKLLVKVQYYDLLFSKN